MQNGGGLRASIGGRQVTMGDVLAVLPFQNTLSTFNIPGAGIVAALENGVSQVEEGGGPLPAGRGAARSPGIRRRRPTRAGSRPSRCGTARPGRRSTRPRSTSVATNNFMRNGGDGYVALRDEATNAYDFGPGLEEVLADYLAAHPDYSVETEGRITRLE